MVVLAIVAAFVLNTTCGDAEVLGEVAASAPTSSFFVRLHVGRVGLQVAADGRHQRSREVHFRHRQLWRKRQ